MPTTTKYATKESEKRVYYDETTTGYPTSTDLYPSTTLQQHMEITYTPEAAEVTYTSVPEVTYTPADDDYSSTPTSYSTTTAPYSTAHDDHRGDDVTYTPSVTQSTTAYTSSSSSTTSTSTTTAYPTTEQSVPVAGM